MGNRPTPNQEEDMEAVAASGGILSDEAKGERDELVKMLQKA